MEKSEKELRLDILQRCKAVHPEWYYPREDNPKGYTMEFLAQAAYLLGHDYLEAVDVHGYYLESIDEIRITSKGIDYLENGGEPPPIMIKLHPEAVSDLRELLTAKIDAAEDLEPAEKTKLRKLLDKVGDAAMEQLFQRLVDSAIAKGSDGVALLERLL